MVRELGGFNHHGGFTTRCYAFGTLDTTNNVVESMLTNCPR
jgi:hypothetical protein